MKVSEFLKRVKETMSPETWTKGTLARDSKGERVALEDPSACKFCAYGYLWHTRYKVFAKTGEIIHFENDLYPLLAHANPDIDTCLLGRYNDAAERTFEDIVKVFDNTLQYAEERGL